MKKRLVSLVLVLSLVLGSMSMGFAAGTLTADINDAKVVKAVERLAALGIVNGMEDGKYHPELKVTREQFAKLLVESLGLGSAANAAMGATKFSDVEAARWSAGYVNVASGQGLIKGYPDGTFGPAKEVTYAEALTMLVRALGYKDEFLPGSWPGNYVAKAAGLGITAGVNFSADSVTADRGSVAVMVDNTLDAKIVKVKEFGDIITYEESQLTLLEDKLELTKLKDVRVIANKRLNDSLDSDEVTLDFTKEIKDANNNVLYKEGTKDFTSLISVENVMGQESTIYINDDDEIVYAALENDDKAKFDYVEGAAGTNNNVTELSLVAFDDDYKLAEDAVVYVMDGNDYSDVANTDGANKIEANLNDVVGKVGKFVIKNNEIIFAEIMKNDEAYPWMFVTKNDKGMLEGVNGTDESFSVDLTTGGDFDGFFVMDTKGNALKVEDIAANDIVYVQKQDVDGDDYASVLVVKDNKVEGKLGKVKSDRAQIGGKEVKVVKYALNGTTTYDAYYSVDNGDKVKQWGSADWNNDMKDAADADMVAYLDAAGRIAYLTTEVKETSGFIYGVVTKAYADGDRVKVFTNEDKEVVYNLEETNNFDKPILVDKYGDATGATGSAIEDGDVVKFKLNKDGEIAEDELYVVSAANSWKMQVKDGSPVDFGDDSIAAASESDDTNTTFAIDTDATIIDAKTLTTSGGTFDSDEFGIAKWADLAEDSTTTATEYYVFTSEDNNIDIEGIVFIGEDGANTTDDTIAVYAADKWLSGGDAYVEYMAYGDTATTEKEVKSPSFNNFDDERPYVAEPQSDGKITLFDGNSGDFKVVYGVVANKDGNTITLKAGKGTYKLSSNTVVYEEDSKKSTSNVRANSPVYFIVENDVNVRVLELLINSEATAVINGNNPYTELNTSALDDAKDLADAVVEADYTAESFAAFETAYAAAKLLPELTQAQIDAKVAAINDAIALLVEVEAGPAFTFAVYSSTVPGSKQVTVDFTGTEDPANYTVMCGTVELVYDTDLGVFAGTVVEADAVEGNIVITAK